MSEGGGKKLAGMPLGFKITEVDSPERIARVVKDFGCVSSSPMGLANGGDFTTADHRCAAFSQVEKEDPYLLVGSPPGARGSEF